MTTDRLTLIKQAVAETSGMYTPPNGKKPKLPVAPQDYKPGDRPFWHPAASKKKAKAKDQDAGPPKKGKKSKAKPPSKIQTVILSKSVFKSKAAAKAWLKKHDFSRQLDETKTSYRARQIDPGKFKSGSFRTINITKGVKAVVGRKK